MTSSPRKAINASHPLLTCPVTEIPDHAAHCTVRELLDLAALATQPRSTELVVEAMHRQELETHRTGAEFLQAWKDGIRMTGACAAFHSIEGSYDQDKATDRNDIGLISLKLTLEYLECMSGGQRALFYLMASLYNAAWGKEITTQLGVTAADLSARHLDDRFFDCAQRLLRYYPGW